jgi:hypothetical protein
MDAQGMDAPEVDFFMSEYTFMHVSFGSCWTYSCCSLTVHLQCACKFW